ncbi:hypothetical protein [Calothrix sp. 336/3]|uniref:hypothetical protein n=1 Tax=Calothrix sp. 336/3 TaxID=1337936 RepID=UPI000550641B|nr:hypothetical protein [Calothrix sp. 336/3]AKG24952.1 hypothetical protein IJ00_26805 [Calothrix sp. 336/3]
MTTDASNEEKSISLRILMPEKLKNQFKGICAMEGSNMSEMITQFVQRYVDDYETRRKTKK